MLRRNSTRRASSACISGMACPFTRYVASRAFACSKDMLSKTFYKCRPAHKRHNQHHPTQGSATPDASRPPPAERDLDEAWQHDLGDDGIVDTSLLSPGLIVVATVLRHDEVQRRKDVQALAAPADAADPAFQTLWLSSGRSAEIPVIAVAAAIRERDRRGQ